MLKFFVFLLFWFTSEGKAQDQIKNNSKLVVIDISQLDEEFGISEEDLESRNINLIKSLNQDIDLEQLKNEIGNSFRPTTNEKG